MQKLSQNILTREQFIQLRKAKTLIKDEFGEDVRLQDDDILDQIYGFALESSEEQLFDLFSEIARENGIVVNGSQSNGHRSASALTANGKNGHEGGSGPNGRVKIGDIVDGRTVTGMYRGKPTFRD